MQNEEKRLFHLTFNLKIFSLWNTLAEEEEEEEEEEEDKFRIFN